MTDRIVYLFQEKKIKGRSQADIARAEGKSESAISKYIKRHRPDWQQLEKYLATEAEWEQQLDELYENCKMLSCWEASVTGTMAKFSIGVVSCAAKGEFYDEMERGPFGKHKEYIFFRRDGDPSLCAVEKDGFTPDLLKGGVSENRPD